MDNWYLIWKIYDKSQYSWNMALIILLNTLLIWNIGNVEWWFGTILFWKCYLSWNMDSSIFLLFWLILTTITGKIYSSCWQPITRWHADHVKEFGQYYLSGIHVMNSLCVKLYAWVRSLNFYLDLINKHLEQFYSRCSWNSEYCKNRNIF